MLIYQYHTDFTGKHESGKEEEDFEQARPDGGRESGQVGAGRGGGAGRGERGMEGLGQRWGMPLFWGER